MTTKPVAGCFSVLDMGLGRKGTSSGVEMDMEVVMEVVRSKSSL